ncbi:Fibronectin type III domain protein [Trichostrongylus colubriformis]|uniref:Fibronectin type III domain protein n=1 Tax=Trichostrongylus colubriformis TaxID=6319 RepID=A0AAN8FQC4_TRICO
MTTSYLLVCLFIVFVSEYYPEDHPDYANVIETKASLVRLRGLDSGTPFRIKINSVYNGVPSTKAIESIFRTTGTPEYDYDNSAETFSIRTLPPGFDLATTTMVPSGSDYMYSTEDLDESSKSSVMSKQPPQITTRRPVAEEIETYDDQSENQELLSAQQMASDFGEPSWISMSDEENMIRLNWTVPDGSLCDAFLVNYTVITLTRPKSFSVATTDDFLLIKFFTNHTLDVRVFCMLAGSVSKTWWAHRIIQMTNPQQVQGFRIVSYETDEFYVSRISVDWDWPPYNNFDLYQIIVSYGINDGAMTEVEVTEAVQKPLVLDKLEPTQRYRVSVPPLISSMISPGKISSTSININFGDSDIEQGRFDYYELVFTGNNKNITKKIEINQEKSLTFTKLIPGKTYLFTLFTVYKGVRSRPVTEAITTYPLKVNALYPVVGREYVVLYWDIENFADSDCRFRLSYNADRVATVSVELKGASRHRFNALMPDVYYTFTITVIMGTGKAAAESESEMITVYVPREGRFSPTLQRQGSRELTVKFGNDHQVFSPLNGAIENVAVIVSDAIDVSVLLDF